MTLSAKTLTNLAIAMLMIGVAVWASMKVMNPSERVVGVVEVGEIQ